MVRTLFAVLLVLAFVAAGAARAQSGGRRKKAAESDQVDPDELYSNENPLADKTYREHDLVTITIKESNKAKTEMETELAKASRIGLTVNEGFNIKETKGGGVTYQPLTAASKRPNLDISHARKMTGEGDIEHTESFEAEITAEVVEVLPNGQLVLEARKRVSIGEEHTELVLTGRVRPEDVRSDNTVDSDRVADAHIQYKPKGAVADSNKRGLLHRLFDFVNIF